MSPPRSVSVVPEIAFLLCWLFSSWCVAALARAARLASLMQLRPPENENQTSKMPAQAVQSEHTPTRAVDRESADLATSRWQSVRTSKATSGSSILDSSHKPANRSELTTAVLAMTFGSGKDNGTPRPTVSGPHVDARGAFESRRGQRAEFARPVTEN